MPFLQSSYQIQESSKSAQLRVRAKQENVSGVMLPAFEMYNEGGNGKVTTLYFSLSLTPTRNTKYIHDD